MGSSLNIHLSRLCNHIYATRSKSARNIALNTDLNETNVPSRRSSDSSVVCLGSFRKIPELINLEDGCDNYETEMNTQEEEKTSRSGEVKLFFNYVTRTSIFKERAILLINY